MSLPAPPTNVTVVPGVAQATVSWTPSTSSVTGYKVFCTPDNKLPNLAASTATSLVVTKLKNGVPCTFRVYAINANGMSASSVPVVPALPPAAPKVALVVGPGGSVVVTVTGKPQKGSTISYYNFSVSPAAPSVEIPTNVAANATFGASITLSGLNKGTSYAISATATGPTGTSLPGVKAIIPIDVPEAPVLAALNGSSSVLLSWSTPFANGLPVLGYIITYFTGTAQPTVINIKGSTFQVSNGLNTQMIRGLLPGTEYFFNIQATNKRGNSVLGSNIPSTPT